MLCYVNWLCNVWFITGLNGTIELYGVGADTSDCVETRNFLTHVFPNMCHILAT